MPNYFRPCLEKSKIHTLWFSRENDIHVLFNAFLYMQALWLVMYDYELGAQTVLPIAGLVRIMTFQLHSVYFLRQMTVPSDCFML